MGDDLQQDENLKEEVATLLGALVDVKQSISCDAEFRKIALQKGLDVWSIES